MSVVRFVAQRLGVTGNTYNFNTGQFAGSPGTINITDLTVYAAFEEAVTTYGNLVYQYKIRDNYINMEGSDTLPFSNNTITYINSNDIASPVTWSSARLATWSELGNDTTFSQSVASNRVYCISASVADFVNPDYNFIKSLTLADNYYNYNNGITYNLSEFVYNQFNTLAGQTVFTPYYNVNSGSYDFTGNTSDGSSFSITGSNTIAVTFKVTSSATQTDNFPTYYVVTGSTSALTTANIASKIQSISYGVFGTAVTASASSTVVSVTSSLSLYDISNYKINNTSIFSNVISGSTINVPSGNSNIYLYTTNANIAGNSTFFQSASVQLPIPTVYLQSNLKPELNGKLLSNNLTTITTRIAGDYGAEAGVGGNYDVKRGSFKMKAGVQDYDLNAWAAASASLSDGDSIEIQRVFFEQAPAIARYFDPYAGTGTGIQSLLETFGFGQMSPGINFMLMPIFFDVLKIQAIELNDQIRKAAFSFDLRNNQLKIFPIPDGDSHDKDFYFEYITVGQKNQIVRDQRKNVITDIMNVPYRNPVYMNINTPGRTWIFKYCLAVCREIEAHIRIQFSNTAIQGIGALQGSELITDARTEKESLITELKDMLNEVSRIKQLERKSQESEFTQNVERNIPLPIYIL
jgi:hypothetical protein